MDLDLTEKVVEKIWYSSWKQIVEKLSDPVYGKDKNLAFRGQSNFNKNNFSTSESDIWQITSSFNRSYDDYGFSFRLNFAPNSANLKKMISTYTQIQDIDSIANFSYIETLN